jgi:hypothetical protein
MSISIKNTVPLFIQIAVLMTSLYVVANNLPPVVGSFRFFWGPSVLLWIFLVKPSVFKKRSIVYLILYGVISLGLLQYTIWRYMGDWHRLSFLDEFYNLLVFATIFFYYTSRNDYKGFATLGKLGFFFVIITIITTNIALFIDPMIVRQSAAAFRFSPLQAKVFKILGAAGYSYAQAMVCLIPIIFYHIKLNKKILVPKNWLIIIIVLIVITMVRAQVMANFLATVIILLISFAGAKKAKLSFIIALITIGIFLVIPTSFYANIFFTLSDFFNPNSLMSYKLKDFAIFIQNPDFTDATGAGLRAQRYPYLLKEFLANPFLGAASSELHTSIINSEPEMWGHLYWMYKFTLWGLPGFLFFVFVLYRIYEKISSMFDPNFRFYYNLSVAAFIFLGLMKNVAGREPFLMLIVIIPGIYFLNHTRNISKNNLIRKLKVKLW